MHVLTCMLRIFAFFCTVFLYPLLAYSAAPLTIRFSHVVAEDTPKGKAAIHLKACVELRSQREIHMAVYPNSKLYKDKEELQALQFGAVHMLAPSLAKFGALGMREFEVFDLPYIFPDKETLYAVTQGPIGQELLKKLESRGIVGLGYWDNGFKVFSANRPLRTPNDFQGLKMRIQGSRVLEAQMRALGATPYIMAFSEVYQGLQTGLVDGTENPPSNFWTQHMQDVQRHMSLTYHGYLGYAVIVNKRFWDGLSSKYRQIISNCMTETTRYANSIAQQENDQALANIRQQGKVQIHQPSQAEIRQLRQLLEPTYRELESYLGADLIRQIRNVNSNIKETKKVSR